MMPSHRENKYSLNTVCKINVQTRLNKQIDHVKKREIMEN